MRLHLLGVGKGTWMYSSVINNARSDEPTKNSLVPHTTNHAPEEPRSHVLRPDLIRKLVVNPDHRARKPINQSYNVICILPLPTYILSNWMPLLHISRGLDFSRSYSTCPVRIRM